MASQAAQKSDRAINKVVLVLFPDAPTGHPTKYARDEAPAIERYEDGHDVFVTRGSLVAPQGTPPTPKAISFQPGHLLGSVSGALGLKKFLDERGVELIVTSDKDGDGCVLEQHLPTADVVISQPFWPAYLTPERIASAPKLKLAITAGVGSDHVDSDAAVQHKVDVLEVMELLVLVRNFVYAHDVARNGEWNIAGCVSRSYDLQGMKVGTYGAGRIGVAALRRLKPFGVECHYYGRHPIAPEVEKELGAIYHDNPDAMLPVVDALLLNCPLYKETEGFVNDEFLYRMKKGAYIVNNARGGLVDQEAVVRALESGHLAGYAGDVWYPQPAPKDHPWRTMPNNAMTPHISGASLSAQARYAAGVREILESYLDGEEIRPEYYIVKDGEVMGSYKPSSKKGGNKEE